MPDDIARVPAMFRAPAPSMLTDMERFEFGQRVANLFANSQLVPEKLRGKPADCFIALHMAERMEEDPIMVMQNIHFVSGRAGWSAQYMLARANCSGKFRGPLRWTSAGVGDDLAVTCFADLASISDPDEARVEVTVSLAQAKADGWTRNEKYKSIPEQMLRWRSATWLIRLYAPEVMMGLPTSDEIADEAGMIDVTPSGALRPPRPRIEDTDRPRATRRAAPVTDIETEHGETQQHSPADISTNQREEGVATHPEGQSEPAEGNPTSDHTTGASAGDAGAEDTATTETADRGIEIVTADGEFIECATVEELHQKWNALFQEPMSPDQVIGLWKDNPEVRKRIFETFGSAAMNASFDRFKQAEHNKRQSQPVTLPGLSTAAGIPNDDAITIKAEDGWGDRKLASDFRAKLTEITNLAPELRKSTIERFRKLNSRHEIRLNTSQQTWMKQHIHPVYEQHGVRV